MPPIAKSKPDKSVVTPEQSPTERDADITTNQITFATREQSRAGNAAVFNFHWLGGEVPVPGRFKTSLTSVERSERI